MTKGNMAPHHTHRTQSRGRVSQALRRIRQAVRQHPSQRLTALLHHLTVDWLREAYLALQRDAAPAFFEGLLTQLQQLRDLLRAGQKARMAKR